MHIGPLFGNDAALLTCYGIDCITPNRGCVNLTRLLGAPWMGR